MEREREGRPKGHRSLWVLVLPGHRGYSSFPLFTFLTMTLLMYLEGERAIILARSPPNPEH